jgi:hypothetical protein
MQNLKETKMISEKDVEAERFAFDLAAKFDIDLTKGKPLIGYELYEHVACEALKRGVSAELMCIYAALYGEAHRSVEGKT